MGKLALIMSKQGMWESLCLVEVVIVAIHRRKWSDWHFFFSFQ